MCIRDRDRLGHDRRYGIDPTKIKNDLGWYPETPFEKGIVLTIDWYLEHEEWMKNVTSGILRWWRRDCLMNVSALKDSCHKKKEE